MKKSKLTNQPSTDSWSFHFGQARLNVMNVFKSHEPHATKHNYIWLEFERLGVTCLRMMNVKQLKKFNKRVERTLKKDL